MSSPVVEPKLFDFLDEIPALLKVINNKETRQAEKVLKTNRVETCLSEFVQNFSLQFFRNGCGISIDGVNAPSLIEIRRKLGSDPIYDPMVNVFEQSICLTNNLERAVYSSPPRDDILKDAYLISIPSMLDSFQVTGKKMADAGKKMAGFDQCAERISMVLENIEKVKNGIFP